MAFKKSFYKTKYYIFMSPSSSPESFPLEGFEYALLDSGRFQKLERFGPYTFIRPAAQSIWPRRLADTEWK